MEAHTIDSSRSPNRQIAGATVILMVAALLGRAVGFLKEVLVTAWFGTSPAIDAFVIALIVPILLANLIGGAVQVSLIPVYIESRMKEGEEKAARLLSTTLTCSFLLLMVLTFLIYLGAPRLVPWLGVGFDQPTKALLVHLARILAPLLLLQAAIGILSGLLNVHGSFALPAFSPMATTLTIITLLIVGRSWGIEALAWGTVFGFLTCLLIVAFGLLKKGIMYRPRLDLKDLGVQRVAALSWPMFLGSALAHANIYVDQVMASALKPGSVAALNYANKLYEIPSQLFILSLSAAVFPFFARQAAEEDLAGLKDSFVKSVRVAAFVLLPLSALLVALSYPLVKILFQRGAFDEQATLMTSQALAFYAIGLFPLAYAFLNARVYNVLQDAKTLRNVAFMNLFLNAGLNLLFMQFWAHAGIALSTSVTYMISGIVLYSQLVGKWKPSHAITGLGGSLYKIVLAATLCAIGSAATYSLINRIASPLIAKVLIASGIGGTLYYLSARVLHIEEISLLWSFGTKAVLRRMGSAQGG